MTEETFQCKYPGKITPKTLGFDQQHITKLMIDDEPGIKRDLFIVTGDISSLKTGEDKQFGPWVKFMGDIAANDRDGEINRGGELCLPSVISPILEGHVREAQKDKSFKGIHVDYEIGVEKTAQGYKYSCKNLNPGSIESDPMAMRLRNLVKDRKKVAPPKKKATAAA